MYSSYGEITSEREEKVGVTVVLRVRKYGSGLYLRLPNDIAKTLGIHAKDTLRVKLESVLHLEVEA